MIRTSTAATSPRGGGQGGVRGQGQGEEGDEQVRQGPRGCMSVCCVNGCALELPTVV